MLRDYLAGGFLETPHPMRYAEAYYDRFPKVAIGHYPPGFYLAAGTLLLPFRAGPSFLVLMNLIGAGVAVMVWLFARRLTGNEVIALGGALLYLLLPQTRTYTAIVMADLLVVLFGLLSAAAFARFLESGRSQDSLTFGFWAAAAILTKGSAVGLALLPPLAILFAGRWRVLLDRRLWLAPVPVVLLALPWMLLTMGITEEGMQKSGLGDWLWEAIPFYGRALVIEVGWVAIFGWIGAGLSLGLSRIVRKRGAEPTEAVLWALLFSGMAIPMLVPAGLDNRYLMPVMPSLLLLGFAWVSGFLQARGGWIAALLPILFLFLVGVESFRPVRKYYSGASGAVRTVLLDRKETRSPSRILAVSDAGGEGAIIAAAALQAPGDLKLSRGTKMLASTDWMGRGYKTAFSDAAGFWNLLDENRIGYVIVEAPRGEKPFEHWVLTARWLEARADSNVERIGSVEMRRKDLKSSFEIYRIEAQP